MRGTEIMGQRAKYGRSIIVANLQPDIPQVETCQSRRVLIFQTGWSGTCRYYS